VRCAELELSNGDFVEVFGETVSERDLFGAPVVGFQVEHVASARSEMEGKGRLLHRAVR
jgi:hypothetical protein